MVFFSFSVILSNYYDLPFNDILDWKKFAVILKEKDVYQLKSILKSIPHEEFLALHKRLVEVCFYTIYALDNNARTKLVLVSLRLIDLSYLASQIENKCIIQNPKSCTVMNTLYV